MKDSDEFSILKKVFKNLGNQYFDSSNLLIGPGDDAGLFKTKKELDKYSTKENLLHQGYVAEIEHLDKPILKEFIKEKKEILSRTFSVQRIFLSNK